VGEKGKVLAPDTVILFDVYHLLNDPPETMEDIHRMLKPAGRPHRGSPASCILRERMRRGSWRSSQKIRRS
ncbi:MAG: hypothetical protein RQ801_08585, partial [Spirochaetaceae bacterium]|nr:hypothetical protein [Spirochaetaceae bacterium]